MTVLPPKVVELAIARATNSPCKSKRGAVIFREEPLDVVRILSSGFNHKPHSFERDGSDACKATCRIDAVHAEEAAIVGATFGISGADIVHVKVVDGTLVPSGPPSCPECSKLILEARLIGVWLFRDAGWKRYGATDFHRRSLRYDRGGVERKLRQEWWLNHGMECRPYGDDGEMQCCGFDFKRAPLDVIETVANAGRTARIAVQIRGGGRREFVETLDALLQTQGLRGGG